MLEVTGYVKLPRIRKGQFSPNEEVDMNCRLVYDKLYLHANFTHNKKSGLLKGQVVMTVAEIAKSCYFITENNVITCLDKLVEKGVILKERFSRYRNKGYKITILNYYSLKLSTACGTPEQLPNVLPNTEVDLTSCNNENILTLENDNSVSHSLSSPETIHNYVNYNNSKADDKSSAAPSKPKKPRSPAKPKEYTSTHKVWLAYAESYLTRYGGEAPYRPRNAYVVIKTMLEQTDEEELAKRVKFYVESFNDSKVVAAKHPITWLDSRMNEVVEAMNNHTTITRENF